MRTVIIVFAFLVSGSSWAQSPFNYQVNLDTIQISQLPGIHSYAFGQSNGKWLIVGGRTDGIHARQPFNAFPASSNNTNIYVIDPATHQFWSASILALPSNLSEQLSSTNMNFLQVEDTLYIAGGYGYSNTSADHITFPYLTTLSVSGVINDVINNVSPGSRSKQVSDVNFELTGGAMGMIGEYLYLVGGQKFNGRYNPMGMPTFTQQYSNQIRKFKVNNSGTQPVITQYTSITDPVHLRRRDYNLLPQIFPDRSEGLTIFSGVFQPNVDLPFLYPVDISSTGYIPQISFNQYLSNYHCAKAGLYDSTQNKMHNIFFGGISQYYYQNGMLIQDNLVPFVKTISVVSRSSDSTLQEYVLPVEMPNFQGASSEFILNENLAHYGSGIIKLHDLTQDTTLIGHIFGGIKSNSLNPFSGNQTNTTTADFTIIAVSLIKGASTGGREISIKNPYDFNIYPNPAKETINLEFELENSVEVYYYITNPAGQILKQDQLRDPVAGANNFTIDIANHTSTQMLNVTLIFDNTFTVSKALSVQP